MRATVWGLVWLVLAGCDRDATPAPTPGAGKKDRALVVEVRGVTPLPPDRRTHVAATGTGLVYWVQEAEAGGGREYVFAMSEGGLPGATKFSNAAVAEALGQAGVSGSIQSLVVGSDQKLYFFFTGGTRRKQVAALGTFAPDTGQTRILADTEKLTGASGMGASLALARGSIVRVGNVIWLWLRHEDGYALLALDLGRPGAEVRRPFEWIWGGGAEGAPKLTSMTEELAAGPEGSLMYLERGSGRVWRIDAQGEARVIRDLSDLPKGLTSPVLDDAGRMVTFAPEGPTFGEREPDELEIVRPTTKPALEYPALVVYEGATRYVLRRRQFEVPARLNVRGLSPRQLFKDRGGWLAYDGQTGELLRLVVVER